MEERSAPMMETEAQETERPIQELLDNYLSLTIHDQWRSSYIKTTDELTIFLLGEHWGREIIKENLPDEAWPVIPLSRWACRMLAAKILSHNFTPRVEAEYKVSYPLPPDHPFAQLLVQFFGDEASNEAAALIYSNILQQVLKRGDFEFFFRQFVQMAVSLGVAGIGYSINLTEKEFGNFPLRFFLIHPSDLFVDPDVYYLDDARWVMYRVPKTIEEVKEEFGVEHIEIEGFTVHGDDRNPAHRKTMEARAEFVKPLRDDQKYVWLETWFIRDLSRGTVQEEREVSLEVPHPVTGEVMRVTRKITVHAERPKYPGGWRMVIRAGRTILYDGEIQTASRKLPIFVFTLYDDPMRIYNHGLGYQTRSLNFSIDRAMKYLLDNARRTSQNRLVVRKQSFTDPQGQLTNIPGGIMALDTEGPLSDSIMPLPAMPLPDAHAKIISLILDLVDTTTGLGEIIKQENIPMDASGRFLEQLTSSQLLEVKGIVRRLAHGITQWYERILLDIIDGMDEEFFIKATKGYVLVRPDILRGVDFDYHFCVRVDDALDWPTTPIEKNTLLLAMVDKFIQYPPEIAMKVLDYVSFPNRDALRQALSEFYAKQAALIAAKTASVPPDKGIQQVGVKAASNVGDVIEDLAKSVGKVDPLKAIETAKLIPQATREAYEKVLQSEVVPGIMNPGGA